MIVLKITIHAPMDRFKLMKEIRQLLEEAIRSTRSLTLQISPPSLYTLGLGAALEEICERFTVEHGMACPFEDDGKAKTLTEDFRAILFRSAGELLMNAAKHANATSVNVSLRRRSNHVELKVRDNGVGFNPSELDSRSATTVGFGLSIRERLSHLGGSFSIESTKDKGTTVIVTASLQDNKNIES